MARVPAFPSSGERWRTLRPIRRVPFGQWGGSLPFSATPGLWVPAVRRDNEMSVFVLATRLRPSFAKPSPPKSRAYATLKTRALAILKRGCREDRVHAAPAVSCASCTKKRTRAYRFSGGSPAFPAQWFYGFLRALPGDRLSCHRSPCAFGADLTPASGRQDHTTSPYAASPFAARLRRARRCCVHRIPRPTFVTMAKRPSPGARDGPISN
jgi:hypothetical protein